MKNTGIILDYPFVGTSCFWVGENLELSGDFKSDLSYNTPPPLSELELLMEKVDKHWTSVWRLRLYTGRLPSRYVVDYLRKT